LGPRGTGKTTWLKRRFPEAYRIDLLDERLYMAYQADPGLLSDELSAVPAGRRVVIDEIQRVPVLLNEVHRQIEEKGRLFALCGSSARKLKRASTNLLAGRAVRRQMHGFVPAELGGAFRIDRQLRYGCLPLVWSAEDPADVLDAYVDMYLKEEIRAEAAVRNLPGFARFLPLAALFHGQALNVSSLARDAGVARTTVEGYLGILEDTLLAFRLPAFSSRLRVRERRHPKLFLFDPGVVRALAKRRGAPTRDQVGHLFEGWIAELLRSYRSYRSIFDDWYYWSPAGARRTEVDFLLERDGELVAIEVKKTGSTSPRNLVGLRAIAELPGLRRRILLYLGSVRLETEDGIDVLRLEDFLAELENGTLFP